MNDRSATRKAALWVGAVFLLGAALGGVLGYLFAHRGSVAAANPPLSEQAKRTKRVDDLTKELNLTDAQRKQLDTILADLHVEYKRIHTQNDQQTDDARQKGRDQIRAILAPEQQPKFEAFLKRMDEERKRNAATPAR